MSTRPASLLPGLIGFAPGVVQKYVMLHDTVNTTLPHLGFGPRELRLSDSLEAQAPFGWAPCCCPRRSELFLFWLTLCYAYIEGGACVMKVWFQRSWAPWPRTGGF